MQYTSIGETISKTVKRVIFYILMIILFFFLLGVATDFFGTVRAGERGVKLRFGAVTGIVLDEGLYFKVPLVEEVVRMDVKIQKAETEATAASKDLQTVNTRVALNFHVNPAKVKNLYQEVGLEFTQRLISPALQESVKASTAQFTAEELITKRPEVREKIKNILREKLEHQGVIIDDFNIVDFSFSQAFDAAIESKVTAEQEALAAKNKLEKIKFEAQQKIEAAKGSAEAIRIEAEALSNKPQILQLRALEKWDGVLPKVTSGAVPFIDASLLLGTK